MHGQFVWYELMTPDTDAARKFYTPIAGWGTQPFDQNYTLLTTGGAPFAGLHRLSAEERQRNIPPNWLPYVESSNVDETTRLASSLGAKIVHAPSEIPNVGRFAIIQDPQGAVLGVYKPSGPAQSWDGTPVLGRFSWHELMTTDHQKAFEFYKRLFGWEKTGEMDMGGGNMYLMYGKGQPFGGMFTRPPEMASMSPFWLCYIHVKDVRKAVDTATKNGAFVQRPPMEIPGGGMIAIMGDPQGAAFAVHHASASTAARPAARTGAKSASKSRKKSAAKKSPARSRSVAKKARRASKKRATAKKSGRRASASKRRSTKARKRSR